MTLRRETAAKSAKAAAEAGKRNAAEARASDDAASALRGGEFGPASQWTFNPSAPWEALARGAGFAGEEEFEFEVASFADDDEAGGSSDAGVSSGSSGAARKDPPSDDGSFAEEETNAVTLRSSAVADRAAAFAASLAGGDISGTFDEGDFSPSPGSSRDGERPKGVGATTVSSSEGSSEETEEDAELVATRRRMEARLASLARRRAELTGANAPSAVTVAKFTSDLARYKRLRADLGEWSDAFYQKYRRRPTTKDVERTGIDFLVENFKAYVALRDKLMAQTPHLRGRIEDVARDALPTPRNQKKNKTGGAGARPPPQGGYGPPSVPTSSRGGFSSSGSGGEAPRAFDASTPEQAKSAAAAMKRAAAYKLKRENEAARRARKKATGDSAEEGTGGGEKKAAAAAPKTASEPNARRSAVTASADSASAAMRRAAAYRRDVSSGGAGATAPDAEDGSPAAKKASAAMKRARAYKRDRATEKEKAVAPEGGDERRRGK